jgi:hypothetical protein
MTVKTTEDAIGRACRAYNLAESRGVVRSQHEYMRAALEATETDGTNQQLLAALVELTAWVERAVVPGYTERKPMPVNCERALAAAHAAIDAARA